MAILRQIAGGSSRQVRLRSCKSVAAALIIQCVHEWWDAAPSAAVLLQLCADGKGVQRSPCTDLHVRNACQVQNCSAVPRGTHAVCLPPCAATVSDNVEVRQCSPFTGLHVLNTCQVVLLCPRQVIQTTAAVPF